jgi:hypothetical protein
MLGIQVFLQLFMGKFVKFCNGQVANPVVTLVTLVTLMKKLA